jgi:hypothetical protein
MPRVLSRDHLGLRTAGHADIYLKLQDCVLCDDPVSALLILVACFVPNVEMFLGYNVAERLKSFSGGDNSKTASVEQGEMKIEQGV